MTPLRRLFCALLLLGPLSLLNPVTAGEVLQEQVDFVGGRYRITFDVLIHAAEPRVRALLTDYPRLVRVNPAIKKVVVLTRPDAAPMRMRVVTRACLLWFCRTLIHVQEVREASDGALIAEVLPQASDFRYGKMVWRILPTEGGTRLQLHGDVVPAFWVPPVIGPFYIKRKLREEALETAQAVEVLAKAP